jgi:hypothetical protein
MLCISVAASSSLKQNLMLMFACCCIATKNSLMLGAATDKLNELEISIY